VRRANLFCVVLATLCIPGHSFGQASPKADGTKPAVSAEESSGFAPLDRWSSAVLAGDKAALTALYSTDPPARAQTPQGKSEDPNEEPTFWLTLASKGLLKIDSKILQIQRPQPLVAVLVLRIELAQKDAPAGQQGVVSAAQAWVQQPGGWRIFATQRSDVVSVPTGRLTEPAKPNTDLYPPPDEAQKEIDAALAASAKDGKRAILVFGANWCFDCHVLDESFHAKDIAPLVEANYHVVHVNIGEMNKNLDVVKRYDSSLDKGVPALTGLDSDGKVVFSQKQGEFESSARLGPEDVIQFLQKWKPAVSQ
jgi:thioredoxin 1